MIEVQFKRFTGKYKIHCESCGQDIKEKLTTVAEDNGWNCQMNRNNKEEIKFVLMPNNPKDSDSFVPHEEMIAIIKDEFSTFEEDSMEVLFTPHVRWMLPIITVIFH